MSKSNTSNLTGALLILTYKTTNDGEYDVFLLRDGTFCIKMKNDTLTWPRSCAFVVDAFKEFGGYVNIMRYGDTVLNDPDFKEFIK